MKKLISVLLTAFIMGWMMAPTAAAKEDKNAPLSPEFIEEGISKAVLCLEHMAEKIDEMETLETEEDARKMEFIFNSIEMRNVRKKYGKIELTDEHRERLVVANMKVAEALIRFFDRVGAPLDVREAMKNQMNEDFLREEIAKDKTLRDHFQTN